VHWLSLRFGPPMRALRGVMGNRAMRRAELAFACFNVAEAATWIALLVYAFDRGGTRATGLVGLLLLVPAGVVAPIAATLGDRYRRERVVLGGYAAQALTAGAAGVAIVLEAPAPAVYGFAMLAMSALTTGRPGHHSLLPGLAATPDELTAGNAVSSLAEGLGGTAGTVAVTILLATAGPGAAFLVMAAVLAIAAALAWGIGSTRASDAGRGLRPFQLLREAGQGLLAIGRSPGPRLLVGLAAVLTLSFGVFDVLLVTVAIDELGIGDAGVGLLHTAMGIGVLVGAAGSVALVGRRTLVPALVGSAVVFGLAVAGTGFAEVVAVALGLVFLSGAGLALLDVAGRTLLQRVVDDALLTRVFGAIEAMWSAGVGVGAGFAVVLVELLGLRGAFLATGAALPFLAVAAIGGLRSVDRAAVVPARQLELLRSIAFFAPLPHTELERVARQLDRVDVTAGTELIHQGDVGDRFYVIDAGRFDVAIDGEVVRTMAEGDHVGEIALLHDVPRTATVRAATDGAVWALERDEFLATITGLPQAHQAARSVSEERLRGGGNDPRSSR
jgi:hypothetical protein